MTETSSAVLGKYRCVLLTSDEPHLAAAAEAFARVLFDVRHVSRHARRDKRIPDEARALAASGEIDLWLNFLAPMIVPASVLSSIRLAAVNFHPGPPEWPGVGSASHALYFGDPSFGVTAHRMTARVDAGEILRVHRFPIAPDETCDVLSERALDHALILFYEIAGALATGQVQASGDQWTRPAITRAEFEQWMTVEPSASAEEISRKVRALRHRRFPGPFMEIDGVRVDLSRQSLS